MPDQVEELRDATRRFFRRFGVLAADRTPCGEPLSLAHAHALMALSEKGELSQQALAADLCIDKSNVARVCKKMVEAGHVRQAPSPSDGRSRLVRLTFAGAKLAEEVDVASRARFGALLAQLPPDRRCTVIAALQDLVDALGDGETASPLAPKVTK